MPFCETCRAEYELDTATCAECNTTLVDALPHVEISTDMTDVFECYDAQEAERVAEVLMVEGLAVLVRDRSSSAFPTTVGHTAKQLIAVPAAEQPLARNLIEAAVTDGIISSDGRLLDA
ncbi:MAG: hypothetical protein V3T05_09835 [Myxococcota bacterium]